MSYEIPKYLQIAPEGYYYKFGIELKREVGRPRILKKGAELTPVQLYRRQYAEKTKEKRRAYNLEFYHNNKERINALRKISRDAKKLNTEECNTEECNTEKCNTEECNTEECNTEECKDN